MRRQRILRIIERGREDRAEATVPHNFVRGTRIETIYLTEEQHERFRAGALVVVGFVACSATVLELMQWSADQARAAEAVSDEQ